MLDSLSQQARQVEVLVLFLSRSVLDSLSQQARQVGVLVLVPGGASVGLHVSTG